MIELDYLDHWVLTVRDIAASCHFYSHVLGMRAEAMGNGRFALHFGGQKVHLHPAENPLAPHAAHPLPGTADFCLIAKSPMAKILDHLAACGIRIESGPVPRKGAKGPIRSLYVRDPDQNLVEISIPGS